MGTVCSWRYLHEVFSLVPLPHKVNQVAVISSEKGSIIDIKGKKHMRNIPKWGGIITKDGKFGLYAPSRLPVTICPKKNPN
uniref:NWD2 C-terminal beta-propeller domain-containing protein n=1 Tax=Megaselia scalaris TaxID=36166 RepID=T1GZ65_MEGSC